MNAVDANAKESVLLDCKNDVAVLTCLVTPNNINGGCSLVVNY